MYKRNRGGWIKHIDFFLIDVLLMELAFYLSYAIRHEWTFVYNMSYYRQVGCFLALISICVGVLGESYHNIIRRGYLVEMKYAFLHVSAVEIALISITFFMKELSYSREVFLFSWAFGIAFCYLGRIIWKCFLRKRMLTAREQRQVMVVTKASLAEEILKNLTRSAYFDYRLVGVVLTDEDRAGCEVEGVPILGKLNPDMEYLHDHVIDEVYIYLEAGQFLEEKYVDYFIQTGTTVHFDVSGLVNLSTAACVEQFSGRTVVTASMKVAPGWQLLIKRLMDIAGGLVGLLLTGIACIFVVPAIKKADPGPAFFSQTRIGKNGRRFRIYKFRSMYMDAEARKQELMDQNEMQGHMFKMENDPRIIRGIGNFIRERSIDELPQFWNVLKGDMSLVGTRPPTVEEYEMYEMRHLKRVSIKPGITGMWQTSGRNDVTDFEEVVRLDSEYIMNWSIPLDIKLLCKTVLVVFRREGSR